MEQTVNTTLKRWEVSLANFGKVDQWNINEDYSILGAFISSGKPTAARNAVRDCRDYSIRSEYDVAILLSKVQNANRILNKPNDSRINKEMKKINSVGQSKRFVSTTKKLYNEKLRFKDGEYLKDIDISGLKMAQHRAKSAELLRKECARHTIASTRILKAGVEGTAII